MKNSKIVGSNIAGGYVTIASDLGRERHRVDTVAQAAEVAMREIARRATVSRERPSAVLDLALVESLPRGADRGPYVWENGRWV